MSHTETPSLTTEMIRDVYDLKTVIVINSLSFSFESLVDILLLHGNSCRWKTRGIEFAVTLKSN